MGRPSNCDTSVQLRHIRPTATHSSNCDTIHASPLMVGLCLAVFSLVCFDTSIISKKQCRPRMFSRSSTSVECHIYSVPSIKFSVGHIVESCTTHLCLPIHRHTLCLKSELTLLRLFICLNQPSPPQKYICHPL
nr:hypothetical protein BgiMline_010989 [Biomphalaria glabrata]